MGGDFPDDDTSSACCGPWGSTPTPQTNVIPSTAVAHLDCRLLPGQSPEEFLAEIRRVVDDPDVLVEPLAEPEGATSSSTDDRWASCLHRLLHQRQ
ncbi:MAG: peptidase dimerization domain-containing protein [Terriglobia bacterium]